MARTTPSAWDSLVAGFASRRPGDAGGAGHVPGH